MKALNYIFGAAVVGIVITFGMAIYTAVQQSRAEKEVAPISIPMPAIGS